MKPAFFNHDQKQNCSLDKYIELHDFIMNPIVENQKALEKVISSGQHARLATFDDLIKTLLKQLTNKVHTLLLSVNFTSCAVIDEYNLRGIIANDKKIQAIIGDSHSRLINGLQQLQSDAVLLKMRYEIIKQQEELFNSIFKNYILPPSVTRERASSEPTNPTVPQIMPISNCFTPNQS